MQQHIIISAPLNPAPPAGYPRLRVQRDHAAPHPEAWFVLLVPAPWATPQPIAVRDTLPEAHDAATTLVRG